MKHGVLELSCMTTLEEAIEVYGEDLQKQVAIEEMAELTKEICKDFRGKDNREQIIEEIVDVYIVLEQLLIMYDINATEFSETRVNKIRRLKERLEKEKCVKELKD